MKRNVLMRNLKVITVSSMITFIPFSFVNATGLPVVDIAHIGIQNGWWAQDSAEQAIQTGEQIITSAENVLQTVEQVAQTAQQIQMVYNLVKSVSTLGDVTSLVNIGNDLTLQSEEVATLMNTVDGLNYTAATMRQQFETLYPNGTDWSTYDFNNLKTLRGKWNSTLSQAVGGALEAQSLINRIKTRNERINSILNSVQSEDGTVRQLQLTNQLTAALIDSIQDMYQSTVATQRMMAMQQQMLIAEREIKQEQYTRLVSGYTNAGPAVTVPTSLPPIR